MMPAKRLPFRAPKRAKPWPLERAEIFQRQAATERALRRESATAYSRGRESGREETLSELALLYAGREKLRDIIYGAAVEELGRSAGQALGQAINRTVERHREVFSFADQYRRAALDGAMAGVKIYTLPSLNTLTPLSTVLRVAFERPEVISILINHQMRAAA